MFDDLYIPWTPRFRRPETPQPPSQPQPGRDRSSLQREGVGHQPAKQQAPYCNRTLHLARAIVAHATAPFPEIADAISAAFIAFIRGHLVINTTGQPSDWAVEPSGLPLHPQPAA